MIKASLYLLNMDGVITIGVVVSQVFILRRLP